ncbi:MAG TPA: hypothetical protein VK541_15940, partial [Pedobacter sp.]|uniref:hypothetical protein n=1 Tax=Pedobacter sp. TaxID=1411316 RepID=UPI002C4916C3
EMIKGEPSEDVPAEFRFGAPAILRVAHEKLDRRYVSLPQNLHHIWGQPGSEQPGVPLLESQFEMLYGLTGNLNPEGTNIAELASKLGEIPVPAANSLFWNPTVEQVATFSKDWNRYLQFYRAWKSRIAILEPSGDNAFGNARFTQNLKYMPRIGFRIKNLPVSELEKLNVRFSTATDAILKEISDSAKRLIELRRTPGPAQKDEYQQNEALRQLLASHADTADLARELLRYERIGASLKYPLSTKEDAVVEYDDIKPEDLSDPEMRMKLAHDPDGLAGGFHYGFESKAIYKEFWRETFKGGSSSAELQAPAFSSVGAWGKQTARFAGDKTVIKSTTGMGRAHFYAVERIGRIGVLWHKAKHVIEYERTVVPSPYFLEQPKLLGRPVVRKVREYIEILEPLKRYPDFDEQSDEAPGCIKSCQFKSVIIPVRSGWGRDVSLKIGGEVKEFGWEIQLWHPDADPKLFPKPQVVFELMPPADSNLASLTVSLSEPENLRFYTDTRALVDIGGKEPIELTADTTKWPAVKYVDYTDHQLPREKHLSPALDPSSGKGMELIMPDVLDVSPGFERYTLRIDSSELPAGVANRYNSKSGISGKLKAVMMMRTPVGAKPAPGNVLTDLLADSPGSLINDIYNGKFSEIKDINTVKEEISNFFAQQVNGTSLSKKIKEMGSTPAYNFGLFLEIYESGDQKLKNPTTKFLWKQAVESASGLLNRTRATYLEQANIFRKEAAELIKQGGNYKDNVLVALNKYKERLTQIPFAIDYGIESFKEIHTKLQFAVSKYESRLREPFEKADQAIKKEFEDLKKLIDDLGSDVDAAKTRAKNITKSISDQSDNAVNKLKEIKLPGELQLLNDTLINEIQKIKDLSDKLTTEIDQQTQIDTLRLKLEDYTTHFNSTADAYKADFNELIDAIVSFETAQYQAIDAELKSIRSKVEAVEVEIKLQVEVFIKRFENEWNSNVALTKEKIEEVISSVDKELFGDTNQPHGQITKLFEGILYDDNLPSPLVPVTVHKILLAIDERLEIIRKEIKDVLFGDILDNAAKFENSADVERWLQSFDAYTALNDALGANAPTKEILEKSTELANRLNQEFGKLTGQISEKIRLADQASSSLDGVINSGKQVLFNYRTVWNEFTAPGMGLNRKTVSMLVNINPKEIQERLSITPCISRVKQFGNDLDALGLRLPVTNVFEGLLPPKPEWVENIEDYGKSLMNKFNFSDVLSDIGAMRLDKLFPNFKMPNDLRDKIKVTQGFDKQNLYAWVNAEIDFQLGAPQSILNIGPINVKLNKGKFTAKFRMQMDREGNTKKESSGLLAGDWETNIANTPIMIFKDAKAIFENDRMSFDLDPSRMEMPGLLKVLTDASKTIPPQGGAGESDEESGGEGGGSFSMGLLEVKGEEINAALTGRSIPIGVQARLDIGPMNVGGGTTAMTNLSFGGHFLLQFWDTQLRKFGFMTGLGFYLGKQEAPFNFTAFILGGGGYVNSAIVFKPEEGLAVNFVMSVHASVGFAITLGWMNGSVLICMGFEGEYNKLPSTESRIYITIFIQIIGQVDILGLVNVYLGLRLAATYTGAQLVGTGRVKLTIKVCWCLTVSVNKDYQKVFAGDQDNKREIQGKSAIQVAQKISNTLS